MGIDKNWLPYILRKWVAIEIYIGLGGGPTALETVLDYFHYYFMDGQSPSTMVNCINILKLKDGNIEELDKDEIFKQMNL